MNMGTGKSLPRGGFTELGESPRTMHCTAKNHAAGISALSIKLEEGEAKRNDEKFSYAAAWEFTGVGKTPTL